MVSTVTSGSTDDDTVRAIAQFVLHRVLGGPGPDNGAFSTFPGLVGLRFGNSGDSQSGRRSVPVVSAFVSRIT